MGGVLLVYAGLALLFTATVSLVRPLRFLGIRNRRAAAFLLGGGLALLFSGAMLPAPLRHVSGGRTHLDRFVPDFQFGERHAIRVRASPARVFAAIRSVTAREIRFFRLLTWVRSPRLRAGRESILAPPADRPIIDVALQSGFVLLAEEPGHEIVFGTVLGRRAADVLGPETFAALDPPGVSKVAMNFLVEPEVGGWCRVTTETRVLSTDDAARRAFAAYWRLIYPGSALIRRMWLDAVRRRAERE